MKASLGSEAPSFALVDQFGTSVSSEALKGTAYLLYFYPRDSTPGCTREACDFRDSFATIETAGVRLFGVSPDSATSHQRFSSKYALPFSLLVDSGHNLAESYGVWVQKTNYGRHYMGIERSTFLVDEQGKVISIWRAVRVSGHVQEVVAAIVGDD